MDRLTHVQAGAGRLPGGHRYSESGFASMMTLSSECECACVRLRRLKQRAVGGDHDRPQPQLAAGQGVGASASPRSASARSSSRHSRISGNIGRHLGNAAVGGPCRIHQNDLKLRIDDVFYYPDVMVACASEPEDQYYEDEPCLVVEVISPSTETTDRREKLAAYKRVASIKTYLIVDQERKRVERHFRDDEGVWQRADLLDEGRFPIPCPETSLSLAQIYEDL